MFVVVPSKENPIYIEFKKWMDAIDSEPCPQRRALMYEAKKSVESIAEYAYPNHPGNIVGHMIMMRDWEIIEAEEAAKKGAEHEHQQA